MDLCLWAWGWGKYSIRQLAICLPPHALGTGLTARDLVCGSKDMHLIDYSVPSTMGGPQHESHYAKRFWYVSDNVQRARGMSDSMRSACGVVYTSASTCSPEHVIDLVIQLNE